MQISKVSDSFAYDFMKDNKGKCTDLGEVKKSQQFKENPWLYCFNAWNTIKFAVRKSILLRTFI